MDTWSPYIRLQMGVALQTYPCPRRQGCGSDVLRAVFTRVVKVGYLLLPWQLGSCWPPTLYSDNITSFSIVSNVAHPKKMLNQTLSS